MASLHAPGKTTARETLQTTLYDLVAAVSEVAGADEDAVITATVVHLLNFHNVRCTGEFEGYRLVCEVETSPKGDDGAFSHFEGSVSHFENNGRQQGKRQRGQRRKGMASLAVLTNR